MSLKTRFLRYDVHVEKKNGDKGKVKFMQNLSLMKMVKSSHAKN